MAWVLHHITVGVGHEVLETHVNTYGQIGIGKLLLCFSFTDNDHIPAITLTLDRACLGLSDHWSVLLHFDMTDLWENDFPIFDGNGRLALELLDLWIGEAIVAVIPLEAWEAGGLAFF